MEDVKKGLDNIRIFALGALVLFIVVFLTVIIADSFHINQGTYDRTSSRVTVKSELVTNVNNTNLRNLSTAYLLRDADCNITSVHNASNHHPIATANYTSPTECWIRGNSAKNKSILRNWHVNYTYVYTENVQNQVGKLANDTIISVSSITSNFSTYFEILTITIIVILFSAVLYYLNVEKIEGG
jgi:hypothetical protein